MATESSRRAALIGSRWTPYLFIGPAALYLLLFQGYPLFQEFLLSFTETSLLSPTTHVFIGLENYVDLVSTRDFRRALTITAIYTIACVVFSIGIGLLAALLLDRPMRG